MKRHNRQLQLRAPTARTGGDKSISKTRHFSSFDEKVKTCFYLVEIKAQWFLVARAKCEIETLIWARDFIVLSFWENL